MSESGAALEQRPQFVLCSPVRPSLEGAAGGEHQRDDSTCQVLTDEQRSEESRKRDDVHAEATMSKRGHDPGRRQNHPDQRGNDRQH